MPHALHSPERSDGRASRCWRLSDRSDADSSAAKDTDHATATAAQPGSTPTPQMPLTAHRTERTIAPHAVTPPAYRQQCANGSIGGVLLPIGPCYRPRDIDVTNDTGDELSQGRGTVWAHIARLTWRMVPCASEPPGLPSLKESRSVQVSSLLHSMFGGPSGPPPHSPSAGGGQSPRCMTMRPGGAGARDPELRSQTADQP